MANAEHLGLLSQGDDVWNNWRAVVHQGQLIQGHLSGANLIEARLV